MIIERGIKPETTCFHCGEKCEEKLIVSAEKNFCCEGCRLVYDILNKNDLCTYYDLEKNPGLSQKVKVRAGKFDYLEDEQLKQKLIEFRSATQSIVTLYLPQIHCSSCIWLLENLNKLNRGIQSSRVNFLKKEITITYSEESVSLKKIAEILTQIGYEPHISLHDVSVDKIKKTDRSKLYKLGIAGFCFGNIMMLSFPEYFSLGIIEEVGLKQFFSYLNLLLSLPVIFYCDTEFFVSAWKGFKQKILNIDAPIALAIVITFGRSVYEIFSGLGAGYLDSMSGIVFFMLIGRFFQNRTYQTISFDRDYTSYFPVAVTVVENDLEKQIPIADLKVGQRIKIHSNEIIPADAILFLGDAHIDYSFVTGESIPVHKTLGEIIYAGAKQTGGIIELEVVKDVSQSYLTQLWNKKSVQTDKDKRQSYINTLSKYFTLILFSIALLSAAYWYINDASQVWKAVTSVLIVACPCALLLSATFTNGNLLRMLQKAGIYFKNSLVIEKLAEADCIVFDKTGTITNNGAFDITFSGPETGEEVQALVRSLAKQSLHPLSKGISNYIKSDKLYKVKDFKEIMGEGIQGNVNGAEVKLGSVNFVCGVNGNTNELAGGMVYFSVNNKVLGCYTFANQYRKDLGGLLANLRKKYSLSVLSGDNNTEKNYLRNLFGESSALLFQQSPKDKLEYIRHLQEKGKKVIMIGDGLNDAGALMQSDVGIAVSDDTNNFSPACDAVLEGNQLHLLKDFITYCVNGKRIIAGSFIISILYNIVGLYFAVTASLEPVIAAILMPVSSISIVLFTTGMSSLAARKMLSGRGK